MASKVILELRGRGHTLQAVATTAKINQRTKKLYSLGYISQMLNGKEPLNKQIIRAVCILTGKTREELFDGGGK
mgnify:CR=1 FL=1